MIVAAALSLACGGSSQSTGSGLTCPAGQLAQNGACVPACATGTAACGSVCCAAGQTCVAAGQCVTPQPGLACGAGHPACGDGFACISGSCAASNPACTWKPPAGEFAPRVAWQWTQTTGGVRPDLTQVLSTPMVVPLQRNVSDAFAAPAVIFASVASNEGAGASVTGVLRAVSGRDGSELWTSDPAHLVNGLAAIAAGDLDGDGFTEVVAARLPTRDPATNQVIPSTEGLVAFDHQGRFLWELPLPTTASRGRVYWGAPSIANLYGGGEAQVVIGATVVDAHGKIVCEGKFGQGDNFLGPISVVADIDLDGVPEIVTGNTVYRNDCTPLPGWPSTMPDGSAAPDGLVAVARFTDDPHPQIVTVSGGSVRLTDWQGKVVWGPVNLPHATATLKGGGAPTIADFDADGKLEIGVAGDSFYTVFKPFAANPILWSRPTQDESAVTGSSVFDFQNDGHPKVVYGDECYTRVYDGVTGTTVFESPNPSCTVHENPVIADVNRDGRAEIVVATNSVCDKTCPWGTHVGSGKHGITVFKDLRDLWVSTRSVWNEHGYHVTNVGEDGSIPVKESPHSAVKATNMFRANLAGTANYAAPDLAVDSALDLTLGTAQCPATLTLAVRVWNRGAVLVAPGLPVALHAGAATGARVAIVRTVGAIIPGSSETVTFSFPAPAAPQDYTVVANEDETGQPVVGECDTTNNAASVTAARCPPLSG